MRDKYERADRPGMKTPRKTSANSALNGDGGGGVQTRRVGVAKKRRSRKVKRDRGKLKDRPGEKVNIRRERALGR